MGYAVKKIVIFFLAVIVSIIIVGNSFNNPITINNEYHILPEYHEVYNKQTSFNTTLTQRASFNNIKYNLGQLGYISVFEDINTDYIDCGYKADNSELRFYFNEELGELIIFSNQYEACESNLTYISERIYK